MIILLIFFGGELWERITNLEVPKQMHRNGDGSFTEFPLRVVETVSRDSKTSYAIQLCDLLAGIMSKTFNETNSREDTELLNDMILAGFGGVTFNGTYFRPEFPDNGPEILDGPDVVDQMIEIIKGNHNARFEKKTKN